MDLLDTILRTAKAEKYIEKFREEGIGANSLKLLTDEDLYLIGVDDEEARQRILKEAESLIISSENRMKIKLDVEYANSVLVQMPNILKLHYGNLYNAFSRPNVLNCEMQLEPAMVALLTALGDLKLELSTLKTEVDSRKPKSNFSFKKVMLTSLCGVLLCTNFYYLRRFCW